MPKIFLTKEDQLKDRLITQIYGTMKLKRIPQRVMADELGISQQAFGKKLKNAQFTFNDLTKIFKKLEFPDNVILSVMKE